MTSMWNSFASFGQMLKIYPLWLHKNVMYYALLPDPLSCGNTYQIQWLLFPPLRISCNATSYVRSCAITNLSKFSIIKIA